MASYAHGPDDRTPGFLDSFDFGRPEHKRYTRAFVVASLALAASVAWSLERTHSTDAQPEPTSEIGTAATVDQED